MIDADSLEESNHLLANRFRTFLPVVVDIETGGFNSATDAILEISAVILGMDEKGILGIEQTYFHRIIPFEGLNIEEAALKFTGIDPFHPLRVARPEREVMQTMFGLVRDAIKTNHCKRAILVGHNAHFDLGFINADMVSQALLVGWAKSGVAWSVAPGLVFLTLAALTAPIFTGRQVYCTHLCPFGAAQDWLGKKVPWRIAVKGVAEKILNALPVVLLLWGLIITMQHLSFSLVGLEPFAAFVFRVAGWATLAIAVVGLVASLFINRAYCRYGCPTGAMLKFIRFGGSASGRIGTRDYVAAGFALVAIVLMVFR